ncbi:MAG TPA: EI24 domain-containing protein [Paracoccaceae bacterium]|nr:EI24 domain-containing protein [Paracoccaceae bacterium]
MALIGDILRVFRQLGDPRFLWVILKALLLTIILLFGLAAGALWLVGFIPTDLGEWWLIGQVNLPAIAPQGLALGFVLLASIFLMIPVAAIFVGFFLDEVVEAVERKHYPWLRPPDAPGFLASIGSALRFLAVIIGANLLALIIYLLAGPLAPLVFYGLNGYLLGREYLELVAARHLGLDAGVRFRRRYWARAWAAGVLMAVPLTIPVMNLVIPVLGVAVFTHQFHRLHRPASGSDRELRG